MNCKYVKNNMQGVNTTLERAARTMRKAVGSMSQALGIGGKREEDAGEKRHLISLEDRTVLVLTTPRKHKKMFTAFFYSAFIVSSLLYVLLRASGFAAGGNHVKGFIAWPLLLVLPVLIIATAFLVSHLKTRKKSEVSTEEHHFDFSMSAVGTPKIAIPFAFSIFALVAAGVCAAIIDHVSSQNGSVGLRAAELVCFILAVAALAFSIYAYFERREKLGLEPNTQFNPESYEEYSEQERTGCCL